MLLYYSKRFPTEKALCDWLNSCQEDCRSIQITQIVYSDHYFVLFYKEDEV